MHGTGFVAEVWDDVARELAADYTVYALDRRGHGESHKPAADRYHFQDFAEDVCAEAWLTVSNSSVGLPSSSLGRRMGKPM